MIFLLEFTKEYQFFRAIFMMNERGSNVTMYLLYILCIKTGKCIIWKCCMVKFLIQCIILSMQEKQWETCQQYQGKEEGVMKKHDRKRAVILSD